MENRKIESFKDLIVWQESHKLVIKIYNITKSFPKEELYGITSQMRRAAVSVSSNIAEGFSRRGIKEKVMFFNISRGSLTELHNQILIVRDVGYLDFILADQMENDVTRLHRILNGLISKTHELYN